MKMKVDGEWLKKKTETEPDCNIGMTKTFTLKDLHCELKKIHPDLRVKRSRKGYKLFSKNEQLRCYLSKTKDIPVYFYWEMPLNEWIEKAENILKR